MTQTASPRPFGALYLVPAPLDFGCGETLDLQGSMPRATLEVAASLSHWICENAKSARAFLKRVDAVVPLSQSLQTQSITELPRMVHKKGDHDGTFDAQSLLAPALLGHDVGLLSEAGMPAVADPGSSVVRSAHTMGLRVVPLVGPASLLLALASSGLNGQNFAFVGYLPHEADARTTRIRELELLALRTGQTQLFIETPYRNQAMLQALLHTLQGNTRLCTACGLTLPRERIISQPVSQWKKNPAAGPDNATPSLFLLGR